MTDAPTVAEATGAVVHLRQIPFELDGGIGERAAIGLVVLASDQTVEYEFRKVLEPLDIGLYESPHLQRQGGDARDPGRHGGADCRRRRPDPAGAAP